MTHHIKKSQFDSVYAEIDFLIRTAKIAMAQQKLKNINLESIPPENHYQAAALFNRARLPDATISLLRKIVYPSKNLVRPATPFDIAEYAAALVVLGATAEAEVLLTKDLLESVPRAIFYLALIRMSEWNYVEASKLLNLYITKETDEYFRHNGKVNLVQSLIFLENASEATTTLDEIADYVHSHSYLMNKGNVIRYRGNIAFMQKDYHSACFLFSKAASLLEPAGGFDYFLARKWFAISHYFACNGLPSAKVELNAIYNEALQVRHWETLRDLDYHLTVMEFSRLRFLKLYFGTPFESLRERLLRQFKGVEIPNEYFRQFGKVTDENVPAIDVSKFYGEKKTNIKPGQAVHRLYMVLQSDFYRPFNVVALFQKMYPGERYLSDASAQRVQQGLTRLRRWFAKNSIPLTIEASSGEYQIVGATNCRVVVRREESITKTQYEFRIQELRKSFSGEFSVNDAVRVLKMNRSSAGHFLSMAVINNELVRVGKARSTRYFFPPESKSEAA